MSQEGIRQGGIRVKSTTWLRFKRKRIKGQDQSHFHLFFILYLIAHKYELSFSNCLMI